MADGRVDAGPTQSATAPGRAGAELAGTELAGTELDGATLAGVALVGAVVPGPATPGPLVAGAEGDVGDDAGEVVGDASDDARSVAVAVAPGVLAVLPPWVVHAVTARASPSPAPAANFPTKKW